MNRFTKVLIQKSYNGKDEILDPTKFTLSLKCIMCGEVRYYRPADKFQVAPLGLCKPCISFHRQYRRLLRTEQLNK